MSLWTFATVHVLRIQHLSSDVIASLLTGDRDHWSENLYRAHAYIDMGRRYFI